ncbi:proline-rich protein 22-like [Grus japonensis]|uniref:Proline-rich protein 22-like n=1 Tax=Grus japonensis TaxID=30415 RepID=A0ABC9X4Q2_GRUJA
MSVQGTAEAPAPTALPTSIPGYRHIEGQPGHTNVPPGSHDSPSQALGDPAGDLTVSDEELLEEALRLLGCSLDAVGVSQDGPGSGPVPGDPAGTGAAVPHCDLSSLSLPEELLSPDYGVSEMIDAILSLEELHAVGMEPQEPWGNAGMALPPSRPAVPETRGKKRGQSAGPKPAGKRRALAGSTPGGAGGE